MKPQTTTIEIPMEFKKLFDKDWREAAVWGGRFSLKSHTVARVLLIRARMSKIRIACFREFQNSIADSSHQLLADLIKEYQLTDFQVTENAIVNKINGSDFIFKGLHRNEQSIKSIEGIDIAWVEEAQTVSKSSLEILTPTVRKEGSQIIYTYNRLLEDDPVHTRLVVEGRPNTLLINVNYDIAIKYGMMPESVRLEMEDDKIKRPGLYKHKWLGEPTSLERRIYKDWEIIEEIPHEARLERYGLDFGFTNDPTVIVAIYKWNNSFIIDEIAYQKGLSNKAIADIFTNLPRALVIADSAEPKSIDEIKGYGINILGANKGPGSVLQGIQFVQDQRISITKRSIKTIKAYNSFLWREDNKGVIINEPDDTVHEWSNPMDCLVEGTLVKTIEGNKPIETITTNDYVYTRYGIRRVKDSWKVKDNAQVIKVVLSNSMQLIGTPNHHIWTNKGWQLLTALRYGDIVEVWKTKLSTKEEVTSVIPKKRNSIITAVKSFFIDAFGKMLMGRYQKVITYITKMVLKQITDWKISNLLIKPNTDKSILEQEYQSKRIVNLVAKSLGQKLEDKQIGSVLINAKVSGEEITKLTLLKKFVLFVARYLSNKNTNLPKLVPVSVVTLKDEKKTRSVYDITVEDCNEYFADDILVHNSIRYGLNSYKPAINNPFTNNKPNLFR